jgi:hypothetical protein
VRHHRQLHRTRSAGLAVAVLLLAGCGSQAATDDAAAEHAPSGSAAAGDPAETSAPATGDAVEEVSADADASPFPGDTSPDVADAVDPADLTVTAVRTARHDGYDRVVFELSGTGSPGWSVEYVDTPSAQGSGHPIDVPGSAHLQVTMQETSYPYDSGAEEVARGPVPVTGTEVVEGVFYDATFEGTSVAWIGTGARAPFRVYALTGPSRVVVDVAHVG